MSIDSLLPIVFVFVMGLALLLYVILDGYDLGIGLLLPLADDTQKELMIATIGPFWDANETWIVFGVGVLLIAFPQAHGEVLTALYLPVTFMLMGLILRGVAFDFRVKAGDDKKVMWNRLFFVGSLIASVAQGWMLGRYISGLENSADSYFFAALIGLTLPALYVMLGAGWLLVKTEGALFDRALAWGRLAIWPMALALFLVSIATPMISDVIADRWFTLPNLIGLAPIPIFSLITLLLIYWLLRDSNPLIRTYHWAVFAALVLICILAAIGLAYSIYPDIVIGRITIWEAAADAKSLKFVLVGVLITLPMILVYTLFVYRIFKGKATELRYD